MPSHNPPITPLLRVVTLIEVFVLVGSSVLLIFLPDMAQAQWPWALTPFNGRFMGAIYLSALMAVAIMLLVGRWAPARPVLVFILVFTAIMFGVSLLNASRFDFSKWLTWVWFALYLILPLNSAYHLYLYRNLPPAHATPIPPARRAFVLAMSAALLVYGLGLIVAPALFSGFWPWPIDDFHARLYSATFIAGAAGLVVVSRAAARVEFETVGLLQLTLSLFAILGLLVVDAVTHRVVWSLPGVWFWVGSFAFGLIVGLGMLWQARNMPAGA